MSEKSQVSGFETQNPDKTLIFNVPSIEKGIQRNPSSQNPETNCNEDKPREPTSSEIFRKAKINEMILQASPTNLHIQLKTNETKETQFLTRETDDFNRIQTNKVKFEVSNESQISHYVSDINNFNHANFLTSKQKSKRGFTFEDEIKNSEKRKLRNGEIEENLELEMVENQNGEIVIRSSLKDLEKKNTQEYEGQTKHYKSDLDRRSRKKYQKKKNKNKKHKKEKKEKKAKTKKRKKKNKKNKNLFSSYISNLSEIIFNPKSYGSQSEDNEEQVRAKTTLENDEYQIKLNLSDVENEENGNEGSSESNDPGNF